MKLILIMGVIFCLGGIVLSQFIHPWNIPACILGGLLIGTYLGLNK